MEKRRERCACWVFIRIKGRVLGKKNLYSVNAEAEAEKSHRKPILALPGHTKVYRDATDLLRRWFPVLVGVQKVIY